MRGGAILIKMTLGILLLGNGTFFGQGAQSTSQGSPGTNNWRDVPVPLHAHPDTGPAEVRKARDDYWARFFPAPQNGFDGAFPVGAVIPPNLPEIRQEPGAFWAIATFVDYDVHEISTGGVYTEIHFRIDRTVTSLATPQVGELIDVDLVGGTVQTSSGEIHHRTGSKDEWILAPSPGGRYLIQLYPIFLGSFYLAADYWDLSTGVARPVNDRDLMLARKGKSRVNGLSEADAVTYIRQLSSQK
jgi:hypothetical protein